MEKLISLFEEFIKRGLAPSTSLIAILCLFDFLLVTILSNQNINNSILIISINFLSKLELNTTSNILLAFIYIGISNFLSIFNQLIFDDVIKRNFTSLIKKDETLLRLRNRATEKLNEDPKVKELAINLYDYNLYQLIAMKYKLDTKTYVDQAKSAGIFFLSLMISIVILSIKYKRYFSSWWFYIWLIICLISIYIVGREVIISRYRARNKRYYYNYILNA